MGKTTGFKEFERKTGCYKDPKTRVENFDDIYIPSSKEEIKVQASRCMDCGIPFCSNNCTLGNIIPDYQDLVYNNHWKKALEVLHTTNNFPEFTGKICPALCEGGCVLGIINQPITCRDIELAIIENGWENGWVKPKPPAIHTGKKVAIIGAGPSGMAAAQQLARVGHNVTVYERADKAGGCMRYGIPDYKLPKSYIERRVEQMKAEGVTFIMNTHVGIDISIEDIKEQHDAIILSGGSTDPRDLNAPGRKLDGIHFAQHFLPQQNKRNAGQTIPSSIEITAAGKNVVVIGGGDTGSDCVGTSIRQGAKSVTQLELLPMPPTTRDETMPWPMYPRTKKTSSSHDEAFANYATDIRQFSIATKSFEGVNGKLTKLNCVKLEWYTPEGTTRPTFREVEGSEFTIEAELVLLAMGFLHPEHKGMLESLGVAYDQRGNVATDLHRKTSIDNIFAAGDMRIGQSLVVTAISEGRKVAACVDEYLMGKTYLRSAL